MIGGTIPLWQVERGAVLCVKIFGKIMKEENISSNVKSCSILRLKDEIKNKQENESGVAYLKYLHGRL
jgi:hypothetical protein